MFVWATVSIRLATTMVVDPCSATMQETFDSRFYKAVFWSFQTVVLQDCIEFRLQCLSQSLSFMKNVKKETLGVSNYDEQWYT